MQRSFLGQQNTENNSNNNSLNSTTEPAIPADDWNAFTHANDLPEATRSLFDLESVDALDNESLSHSSIVEQVSSLIAWNEFIHANDLPNSAQAFIDFSNVNDVSPSLIDNNDEVHLQEISYTQGSVEQQPSFVAPIIDVDVNTNNINNNNNNNRIIIDLTENDRASQQSSSYLIAELAKTSKYLRLEDYDFFNPITLAPIFENVQVLQCQKDANSTRYYFVLDAAKKEYLNVILAASMRAKKIEFLDKNQNEKILISDIYWDTKFDTLVYGDKKLRLTHSGMAYRLPIPMAELNKKFPIIKEAERHIKSKKAEAPIESNENNVFKRLYNYQYFKASTCEPVEDLSKAVFWASRLVNTTFKKDYFCLSTSQYVTYEKIVKLDELKQADFYWKNGEKVSEDCKEALYYSHGECYVNINMPGVTNHKEKVFLDQSSLQGLFTEEELDQQYAAYYSPSAELKKGIDVFSFKPNADHTFWTNGACKLAKDQLTIAKLSQIKLPKNVYANTSLDTLFFKAPSSSKKRAAEESTNANRKQRRNA